jgi:hypothetical protein
MGGVHSESQGAGRRRGGVRGVARAQCTAGCVVGQCCLLTVKRRQYTGAGGQGVVCA